MESNKYLSLGKQLWLKYFKWIVGLIILIIAGVIYWVSSVAKRNTLAKLAVDIPYPPDTTPPTQTQINAFNEWINSQGKGIVKRIGDELQAVFWISTSKIEADVKVLAQGSDKQLVWAYKYYRTQFVGKSLVTDLERIQFAPTWDELWANQIINRLRKLGAK